MYVCRSILCLFFCLTISYSARPQTATSQTPTVFQVQAQTAVSAGKPFSAVNLSATAEWTVGSLHESGTAQLQANVDGSNSVQLTLGKASRTETQSKADSSRKCTWTDSAGKSHDVPGPNCLVAIPWFSPSLFAQPAAVLPILLGATDDGTVSKGGSTVHQVSYVFKLPGQDASTANRLMNQSAVKVFYDSQTSLPVSLEYFIHPDNDDSQNIPARVAFSNYQSVSGVMLPFHIERYVNRTLLLKLDVSNASIQ
jgi:hypothetical protein